MEKDLLQIENGNFTQIVNPLIEQLIQLPFKGCELAVSLYIIRKTYGFHKIEDSISITQFEKALKRGRPTIVKALKNLQLVNIVKLVKKGNQNRVSNIWRINKYYSTWELVRLVSLVKSKSFTSKGVYTITSKGGLTYKIKKENTKETIAIQKSPSPFKELIEYYSSSTLKAKGFRPKISGADGKALKTALVGKTKQEIEDRIDFYIKSEKADRVGMGLSKILSADSENMYLQKGQINKFL